MGGGVVVGTSRAGGAFSRALAAAGWVVTSVPARPITANTASEQELTELAEQVARADVVFIAVSDAALGTVAAALPESSALYIHASRRVRPRPPCAAPARRLLTPVDGRCPDAETGARRLLDHCTFAIDGDPLLRDIVESLGGQAVEVAPSQRAAYHAAATHCGRTTSLHCARRSSASPKKSAFPLRAYWSMMSNTLDNVAAGGAADALTGPAARADWVTIRAHLASLPSDDDRRLYPRVLCCCGPGSPDIRCQRISTGPESARRLSPRHFLDFLCCCLQAFHCSRSTSRANDRSDDVQNPAIHSVSSASPSGRARDTTAGPTALDPTTPALRTTGTSDTFCGWPPPGHRPAPSSCALRTNASSNFPTSHTNPST